MGPPAAARFLWAAAFTVGAPLAPPVVLANPVGKPRSTGRGFLLAVATASLYAFYWDFRAHMELYEQFELRRERREHGGVWYVLAFLFWALRFVYYYHFAANVGYLMRRMGHPRPLTPAAILGLKIPATSVLFVLLPVGGLLVATGTAGLVVLGVVLAIGSLATWMVLKIVAYARLQSSVNWVWGMYHERARQLRRVMPGQAPAPVQGVPSPAGQGAAPGAGPRPGSSAP